MDRHHGIIRLSVPALASWLMLGSISLPWCAAQDIYSGTPAKPTFTQSVKNGFSKVGGALTPSSNTNSYPVDDPTSLSSNGKPSAELYVSIAKYYEDMNKPNEAEQQYQKALQENPNHLVATLSYARFMENQNRFEDAMKLYQGAIKAYPKNASVYNNLGLCYARKKKLKEAASALNRAVQLDPRSPLYRNNYAAVLVELNRLQEAFDELREVHGDAKAYYNLGYLLNKKGDTAAAEHHFRQALMKDPTMEGAQRWLSYLQNKSHEPSSLDQNFKIVRPSSPAAGAAAVDRQATRILPPPAPLQQNPYYAPQRQASQERIAPQESSMPELSSTPRRLPPVTVRQPAGGNAPDTSENAPDAPLPPGITLP